MLCQPGPDYLGRPQIFTKQKPDAAMTRTMASARHRCYLRIRPVNILCLKVFASKDQKECYILLFLRENQKIALNQGMSGLAQNGDKQEADPGYCPM